ncbi:MAG TPA: lipopolysaccharide biosynthesis protein, partial [Candidatus Eisenbacteria bacterium]|nr:lipopolysaccharide biosynthesis protein [Candidatus Eisenbacteria bacterium]
MSRIRANVVALGISFFTTAFFSFLQIKIITNALDQTSVGVWSAVVAVGSLLATLSELGLPWVMVRYGAKFDAEKRLPRLFLLWKFAVRVYAVGLAGVIGILLVAGPLIATLLGGAQVDRWSLIIGYLAVASGSLRAFNNASFRGLRRMRIIAVTEILFSLTVTIGLILLQPRLTVRLALVVGLISGLIWAGVGLVYLLAQLRKVSAGAPPDPAPVFPEIRSYWQGAAVSAIFLVAIEQLDKPVLATLVAFQQVALFHVASRLALFARRLVYVPFQAMNPEITHKWESGRRDELTGDMELFTKLALALGLSMVVFLAVFAKPLLLLVSTREFLAGAPVLWIFTAVLPLLCLYQPLVMFLRATGKVWHAFVGDAGWLLTYLGAGALLVRPFGLPGFVSGQIVASILVFSWVLIAFHRLKLPRPPLRFFIVRAALGAGVWVLSVMAGRFLPEWPLWAYAP